MIREQGEENEKQRERIRLEHGQLMKIEGYEQAFKKIVKHNELIGSKFINKIAKEILEISE